MSEQVIFDWRACIKRAKLQKLIREADAANSEYSGFFNKPVAFDCWELEDGEPVVRHMIYCEYEVKPRPLKFESIIIPGGL